MWTNEDVKRALEQGGIGTFAIREILAQLLLRIETLEGQAKERSDGDKTSSFTCICESINPTDYRGYCCNCGKPR